MNPLLARLLAGLLLGTGIALLLKRRPAKVPPKPQRKPIRVVKGEDDGTETTPKAKPPTREERPIPPETPPVEDDAEPADDLVTPPEVTEPETKETLQ